MEIRRRRDSVAHLNHSSIDNCGCGVDDAELDSVVDFLLGRDGRRGVPESPRYVEHVTTVHQNLFCNTHTHARIRDDRGNWT